ncbi:hypothetical protein LXJ15735_15650 [Lacrimispora xylanolytica]
MESGYLTKYIDILKRYTKEEFTEKQMDITMLDLGINSFRVIEMMIVLEGEFGINFPDSIITADLFHSPKTFYDGLMKVIEADKNQ